MKKNLVLTGMMGVGKSTIGKSLSERLKLKFIDVDKLLEKQEECSINSIFQIKGEEYFRKIERKVSLNTLREDGSVIALGGGAFIDEKVRSDVLENSISFWLDLNIQSLIKRLKFSKKRPLLKKNNLEENLSLIHKKRKPIYNLANFKINCNNKNIATLTKKISEIYESTKN